MNRIKRIFTLLLVIIVTAVPFIPSSSAVFTGDDRIVVVLDPGHGGKDPGAAGVRDEAYYNLEVARAAKEKLEANGNFIVYMTRHTADKNLTLAERLYFADTVNADVVISIHFNSGSSPSTNGVEVYGSVLDRFYLGTLGQKISSKVAKAAGIQNRGVFRKYDYGSTLYYWSEEYQWDIPDDKSVGGLSDYYGIITWGAKFGIPSLIVEHAYLSNYNDKMLIEDPAVLKAMGEADADALIEYYTKHTHVYGEEIIDAPVTCFSAGKKSVHCSICDHRINVTAVAVAPDPAKHIWLEDEGTTSPTCDSDGYAKYYCRYTHNLNDKGCTQFSVHRKENVIPAYGHDYKVTFEREVTHTVDGIITYTCSRCNESYSDITTAEGHSYNLTEHKDPTCDIDGFDKYTCSVCGESYSDVIPMTGHDLEVTEHTDPSCEAEGSEHRKCKTCGFEEDVTIPMTGHAWVIYADVMPNCTEEGLRETKCSVCGKMETEKRPKTDHSIEIIAEKAATCTEKGELLTKCIVCGMEETVITDPTGHDFEILSETAPTCEDDGSRQKKCRTCGTEEIEVIPPTGHAFDNGVTIDAPGLFLEGEAEYKCLTDSAHREVRPIRDLTVFEYMDVHPLRFTVMCAAAGIIVIGGVIVLIILIRKKKHTPTHAKPKSDADKDAPSEAEEKEPETVE